MASGAVSQSTSYRTPVKTVYQPVTVTRTRTAWARTTRTVLPPQTAEPEWEDDVDFDAPPVKAAPPAKKQAPIKEEKAPLEEEKAKEEPLEEHEYRDDGLLKVNPNGPHPIYELIKRAEDTWAKKLSRASKTLGEAVEEYKRRYKRDPPLGFDDWWGFVEDAEIQLPDEYDQIYNDLEPYWGMDPNDLQEIQREWEGHADSFTVGKEANGMISLVNYTLPGDEDKRFQLSKGAFEVMDLLEDVEEFIPPFRAVFSPHDNPNLHTDYELRNLALKAAATGTYIDINDPPEVKLNGWISACPPLSPAWRDPIDYNGPPPPRPYKSFIHDHRLSMDPCLHPSHLIQHGQFLSHKTGPVPHRRLIPQFSFCPTMLHHDIMPAMPINWVEDIYPRTNDPEWQQKFDSRLQWRGRNTGMWHTEDSRWRDMQRSRLVDWASNFTSENVTVLPPTKGDKERVGNGDNVRKALYAPAVADIAFADAPVSCPPEMCDKLKKIYEYREQHDIKRAGNYKYVIDVDGNGWSSRFKRLITSNSLIFKSTIYPEWYTDRVMPWVHYVPIQVDLSDLYDSLLFFRGNPNGDGAHDDLAMKIALSGREWSKTFWRKEDLTAYMFRLFLEYARVMSPDRKTMSYIHVEPGT
ncbi:glycosyl transferase family 90-domain-containing protein [Crucibulum laeve]|uniref:Glycosyl transferase family 90-domain-containing protein n=1 Tax=Crucibulum laeve TaxID=68775 RepID=A0A5C3LP27_9AGAR|nr:glycosyl transferase family 90-domain-containing protein [Crucibulum laeve]